MQKPTGFLILRAAMVVVLALMPFGSPGDKVGLILLGLLLSGRKTAQALSELFRRSPLLTNALYSSLAIAVTWANSRGRYGGGPFHLALYGLWRGYPLPYEEWFFASNGAVWQEYRRLGSLADIAVIVMIVSVTAYFAKTKIRQVPQILVLSAYSAAFTWLNIEIWFHGVPAAFFKNNNLSEIVDLVEPSLGFPLAYWNGLEERRIWRVLADVSIGITGWAFLWLVLHWTRRTRHSRQEETPLKK